MSELELITIASLHHFIFDGVEIRAFDIEGIRFVVGSDICKALEITAVGRAVSRLDDDDKITLRRSDTLLTTKGIWEHFAPQVQSVVLMTENGTTDLILESRKPKAREFRRWLTHVVWPSIRDTGSYNAPPALTDDEIVHKALSITAARVEVLTARVAELEPKGEAYDEFLDSRDAMSMKLTGEYLGWGRNQLLAQLREAKILRTGGINHNLPYARYDRYFHVIPFTAELGNGKVLHTAQVLVWPESLDWIRSRIGMGPRKPRPRDWGTGPR